jgi:hypothetical protein
MDIKKLEKLENIRNFLENDNIAALKRYVEKIQSTGKKDDDFEEVFAEIQKKNYDQALRIAEDIIYEMKGQSRDEYEFESLEDFGEDDEFMYDDKINDFGDLSLDTFDGDEFFDDKDDDYY